MSLQAHSGAGEKRRHRRMPVLFSATVHQDSSSFDCVIKDISAGGAQLITERPIERDRTFILDIDRAGLFTSRLVWRDDKRIGMMFLHEPSSVAERIGSAWGVPG
jgi:hypothetical protein